jgi:hypothetical protein
MLIACRFAATGCRSPAAEIVYVPEGCICWRDPVQALCEQHLITLETSGPAATLLDLREPTKELTDALRLEERAAGRRQEAA